jgi:flagellar biosynthesis component FlhA
MDTLKSDTPSITLFLGRSFAADRSILDVKLLSAQQQLFDELGIICPLIEVCESGELTEDMFQLQVNVQKLPPVAGLALGTNDRADAVVRAIIPSLRECAAELLTVDLTQRYLTLVQLAFPALIDTVLTQFNVEMLTHILREQLEAGISVKDLVSILEELLEKKALGNIEPIAPAN